MARANGRKSGSESESESETNADTDRVRERQTDRDRKRERSRRWRLVRLVLGLTLLFESLTAFARFGLGLRSNEATRSYVAVFTGGLRVHHGYLGALLLGVAFLALRERPRAREGLMILGAALLLSDLVHHFLVLWPLTGDPSLDVFYPPERNPRANPNP